MPTNLRFRLPQRRGDGPGDLELISPVQQGAYYFRGVEARSLEEFLAWFKRHRGDYTLDSQQAQLAALAGAHEQELDTAFRLMDLKRKQYALRDMAAGDFDSRTVRALVGA